MERTRIPFEVVNDLRLTAKHQFACLTYHMLGDSGRNQYLVSLKTFNSHLQYLADEGFIVESLDHLQNRVYTGLGIPKRYAVITIDDGHCSGLRAADRLAAFGFGATFFVVCNNSLKKSSYMKPAQIRDLHRSGFSVASHGVTHRKLSRLSSSDCIYELRYSRTWLEDTIGDQVCHFAAPGGYYNCAVVDQAFREGYTSFATCVERMNDSRLFTFPVVINRVNIRAQFSIRTFASVVTGAPIFYWKRRVRAAVLFLPKSVLA